MLIWRSTSLESASHVTSARKHMQEILIWRSTSLFSTQTKALSFPANIVRKHSSTSRATLKLMNVNTDSTEMDYFLVRNVRNRLQTQFIWERFLKQTRLLLSLTSSWVLDVLVHFVWICISLFSVLYTYICICLSNWSNRLDWVNLAFLTDDFFPLSFFLL